jgi:hypothetical protein
MTRLLRDAFGDLAGDEPPMRVGVDDVVALGEQRHRRRRVLVGAAAVAALVPVLGLGLVYALPGDSGTPPAVVGGGTSAATNQLPDPGFEGVPQGWAVFGPATVHTPTDVVHGGAQALRITTTSAAPVVAGATNRPVLVITTAGTTYTASCWVRATKFLAVYLQIQEYTLNWQRAGDPAQSTRLEITDATRWYQISITYTAQQNGNQLPLTVFGSDMVAGGAALIADDCALHLN